MALNFSPIVVPDAATYTVERYNSGLTHVVPDLTASCTISLPDAEAGLEYTFMYGGAAADAQNFIVDTGSDTNYFVGGVLHANTTASSASAAVFSDGNSNSVLTVKVPAAGTSVKVMCDGTHWYLNGTVCAATVPTLGDQS